MKAPSFLIALTLATFVRASTGQEPVSLQEFAKKSPVEREEIVASAPAAQKAKLERLHFHLRALERYGSEELLRRAKEEAVGNARGFRSLNWLRSNYENLWSRYQIQVDEENERAGLSMQERVKRDQQIEAEKLASMKPFEDLHDILFRLAPTEKARELARQAAFFCRDVLRADSATSYGSKPPLKEKDLIDAGEKIRWLLIQLRALPQLPSEQVAEEYDAFSDERL